MKTTIKKLGTLFFAVIMMSSFLLCGTVRVEATDGSAIKVEFEPGIVAMPGNQATKVPIAYARIRSTSLRDINVIYGVVSIEKTYNIVQIGNKAPEKVEVPNTFVIHFEEEYADLEDVASDYQSLGEVVSAEVVAE